MDSLHLAPQLQVVIAAGLSLLGFAAIVAGLRTMLAADYQQSLKRLSVQSAQIGQKAVSDVAIAPVLEAAAELITAVNQLVRTAVGVGIFLCLGGVLLEVAAYYMLQNIR